MSDRPTASTDHPHGPEDPRWIDDEGRCVLCGRDYWQGEAARLRVALAQATKEKTALMLDNEGLTLKLEAAEALLQKAFRTEAALAQATELLREAYPHVPRLAERKGYQPMETTSTRIAAFLAGREQTT